MTLPHRKSDLEGMTPGLMHPEADPSTGRDWAGNLSAHMNDVRGHATIAGGTASIGVQLDADLDGQPVTAMLNTIDGTLTTLLSATWDGNGLLTLTGNANATGAVLVSYHVAGKSVD